MKQALYFTASWCQPCKRVRPIVEDMIINNFGNFIIYDVDENTALAKQYELKSVPTFILLKDGKEIARITGAKTREQLEEFIAIDEESNN